MSSDKKSQLLIKLHVVIWEEKEINTSHSYCGHGMSQNHCMYKVLGNLKVWLWGQVSFCSKICSWTVPCCDIMDGRPWAFQQRHCREECITEWLLGCHCGDIKIKVSFRYFWSEYQSKSEWQWWELSNQNLRWGKLKNTRYQMITPENIQKVTLYRQSSLYPETSIYNCSCKNN